MRIWTLHPRYLDTKGLVALWRETLLAKKVLEGGTRGYRNHPQLERFRALSEPAAGISAYLIEIHAEAERRGYRFDATKIGTPAGGLRVPVTQGQLDYEWKHLLAKLARRDPERYQQARAIARPETHPLFELRPGPVEPWERIGKGNTK